MIDNSLYLYEFLNLNNFLYICWYFNYFWNLLSDIYNSLDNSWYLNDFLNCLLNWDDFVDDLGLDYRDFKWDIYYFLYLYYFLYFNNFLYLFANRYYYWYLNSSFYNFFYNFFYLNNFRYRSKYFQYIININNSHNFR
jgi:hypothetical protein